MRIHSIEIGRIKVIAKESRNKRIFVDFIWRENKTTRRKYSIWFVDVEQFYRFCQYLIDMALTMSIENYKIKLQEIENKKKGGQNV